MATPPGPAAGTSALLDVVESAWVEALGLPYGLPVVDVDPVVLVAPVEVVDDPDEQPASAAAASRTTSAALAGRDGGRIGREVVIIGCSARAAPMDRRTGSDYGRCAPAG
jgi:hypothetical protein